MATRAVAQVLTYEAWNTSLNSYQTGDVANHTTSWEKDGIRSATTNSPAEVDATNLPGLYKVTMTSTETDCWQGVLGGKSSTANVVLIPRHVSFVYLNTSSPATAGIPDINVVSVAAAAVNLKKNQAFANFEFLMTDSTNHNPIPGLTVSATRSIDGGAFASCTNSPTGVANGIYTLNLSATDLNGSCITLRFTAVGADDRLVTIITSP